MKLELVFDRGIKLVCYRCGNMFWYNGEALYNIICSGCGKTLNVEKLRKLGCDM
jgi:ribosomal protein S27E